MSDNIKVVVKVRPLISREIEQKVSYQWVVQNDTLHQIDNGKLSGTSFTFDKVYDRNTKTDEVFNDVAKPIVEAAVAGFNGTIFAYGQTSSGKTYTMTGTDDSPGIIPLSVVHLFDYIKTKPKRDFLIRVSYIEIYNETVRDLLNIEKTNIRIHHDIIQGVRVDATEKPTSSPEEVLEAMKEGEVNRQTGATNMNEESSRSHSIFQITIESREHMEGSEEEGSVNVSQLNLVDLAGSERAGQTGATGLRFKEGTHINKSLSVLALVIKQLSDDSNKHANYRDSKLTRILQNSLGGNAKTSIVCAVTPASVEETISTLQFANRAKAIKNKPKVVAVATTASRIHSLTKQLSMLQTQLETKKYLEQDNVKLHREIQKLQKLILNGFGAVDRRAVEMLGGRRKCPQPRRVTISTLHPASDDRPEPGPAVPRFCTPALKYNPSLIPAMTEYASLGGLARVPEERAVSPPPVRNDEVIEIDSDDDDPCPESPYHKCRDTTKTPPCVLRKTAKIAEKNLQDIVELTEREKLYAPTVVELMEKVEQCSDTISSLQEQVNTLTTESKEKDSKLEDMRTRISQYEHEVKTVKSVKEELDKTCATYKIEINDWEVRHETLMKKSKSREEELLSLLAEQGDSRPKVVPIGVPSKSTSNPVNRELLFMDMSKDISLVTSDSDCTIQNDDDPSSQIQDMVKDMQNQLTCKNELIIELEGKLFAQKQNIESLENTSHELQTTINGLKDKVLNIENENAYLKSQTENLISTIESQKVSIETANNDIKSYSSLIQELQIQLTNKTSLSDCNINEGMLYEMLANEEKFIANNENIKNLIQLLKIALNTKNKEIEELKLNTQSNSEHKSLERDLREQIERKDKELSIVTVEMNRLNDQLSESNSTIKKLITVEQDLSKKAIELEELNNKLEMQSNEKQSVIQKLKEENENLNLIVFEKESIEIELTSSNEDLSKRTELLSEKINELEKINSGENIKVEQLVSKNEELNRHTKSLSEKVGELEKILNEEHIKIEQLASKNEELTKQSVLLSEKVSELEKINNGENIKNEELSSKNEELTKQTVLLSAKIDELKEINSKESIEIEQYLTKAKSSINRFNTVLQILDCNCIDVDFQDFETYFEGLFDSMGALEKSVTSVLELNKSFNEQGKDITNMRLKIEQLSKERVDKYQLIEQIEGMKAELIESRRELDVKSDEIIDLETKITDVKEKNENVSNELLAKDNTISILQEKVTSLYSEIENLSKESQESLAKKTDELKLTLKESTETFSKKLIDKDSKIDELNNVMKEVRSNLAEKTESVEILTSEIEHLKGTINKNQLYFEETLMNKDKELNDIVERIRHTEIVLDEKRSEVSSLSEKLNAAIESRDNILANILEETTNLWRNVSISDTTLDNVDCENSGIYGQIISLLHKISYNHIEIKNSRMEQMDMNDVLAQSKIEILDLTQKNNNLFKEFSEIELKNQQLLEELQNVKCLNENLTGNNTVLDELKLELKMKYQEIESMEFKIKELSEIESKNKQLLEELQNIKFVNENLTGTNNLIDELKSELKMKYQDIESMEFKTKELRDQFAEFQSIMHNQMGELKQENEKLITLSLRKFDAEALEEEQSVSLRKSISSCESQEKSPPSLQSICCNIFIDRLKPIQTDMTAVTATFSKSSFENPSSESQSELCKCESSLQLKMAREENDRLSSALNSLESINQHLLKEQEDVRQEVKLLLEPAEELQKRLVNHRTNVSTLTATAYAENKLLKSQLTALKHYHSRCMHLCQRDLPTFKCQLQELMAILKCSGDSDAQNTSFKRYSLPDVLDSNTTTVSNLKNESILDGDMLMLDTNVTLTTTGDNTLMGADQTCLEITQVNFDNEVASQTNVNHGVDPCMLYSQIEIITKDNQKIYEESELLKEENSTLRIQIDKMRAKSPIPIKVDAEISPMKINKNDKSEMMLSACVNCDVLKNELNAINDKQQAELNLTIQELHKLQKEKNEIEEKLSNLSLEIPNTEVLVRKLNILEKEYNAKIQDIAKITTDLNKKNQIIKELQDENDSLSTQVMEAISETDDLKKELDLMNNAKLELTVKLEEMTLLTKEYKDVSTSCDAEKQNKSDIIRSLRSKQSEQSKLSRSLSDSDSSSRYNKICTLQYELFESKEDCKKITEDVASIKNQLECSNMDKSNQAMDLDESMGESNIFSFTKDFDNIEPQVNKFNLANIPEEQLKDIYSLDKINCLNFYIEKTGSDKENLDNNINNLEVMKMLYEYLETKHGNAIENLSNKLRDFEEAKVDLQLRYTDLSAEYSKITKELDGKDYQLKNIATFTNQLRNTIAKINEKLHSNAGDLNFLTNMFKENILETIDSQFGLSNTNIFEAIIDIVIKKHQYELCDIVDSNTSLKEKTDKLLAEFTAVNEELKSVRTQLLEKEKEYDLIKITKDKVHEVCSAVTLDIVKKEEDLRKTINSGCKKLMQYNILVHENIDLNMPMHKNLNVIFENLIYGLEKHNSVVQEEKERLMLENKESNTVIEQKEKDLTAMKEDLSDTDRKLQEQMSLYDRLNCMYREQMEENKAQANAIEELKTELQQKVINIESLQAQLQSESISNETGKKLLELTDTVRKLMGDIENLKAINEIITREKDAYALELEKCGETIRKNKLDMDKMTSDILVLREHVKDNVAIIEKMTTEAKSLIEQNRDLKEELVNKSQECSRLKINIKTHEKTADVQSRMIIRLQKDREEDKKSSNEKDGRIDELSQRYAALHDNYEAMKLDLKAAKDTVEELKTLKDDLESRLLASSAAAGCLSCAAGGLPHGRGSAEGARRRRQSLHDSKRVFADDEDEHNKMHAMFAARDRPDDLFMDVDGDYDSSNRSTPVRLSKGRDSLQRASSRPGSGSPADGAAVAAAVSPRAWRRRRQSMHDLRRDSMAKGDDNIELKLTEAQTNLKLDKSRISSGSELSAGDLHSQLSACRQELEELKERYREVDDECETCAQYLRERDAQCAALRKEKIALQNQLKDLTEQMRTGQNKSQNESTVGRYVHASVNTDEDWANLHSVVVDRMSFDAEVEKNKKLMKTIEDVRYKNQELRTTVAKMQKALEKHNGKDCSRELEAAKTELACCRQELAELKERYRELDDECETCAQYLKERDERCRQLREANHALEAKLAEYQSAGSPVPSGAGGPGGAESARRARHSLHDRNRHPRAIATETSDDLLSYQVERDNSLSNESLLREVNSLKTALEKISRDKEALESSLRAANPQYVTAGSAIVQSQQITDLLKDNHRLKKINSKLIQLCKKRGKSYENFENEDPAVQG